MIVHTRSNGRLIPCILVSLRPPGIKTISQDVLVAVVTQRTRVTDGLTRGRVEEMNKLQWITIAIDTEEFYLTSLNDKLHLWLK